MFTESSLSNGCVRHNTYTFNESFKLVTSIVYHLLFEVLFTCFVNHKSASISVSLLFTHPDIDGLCKKKSPVEYV
jgi:hypothetical protein